MPRTLLLTGGSGMVGLNVQYHTSAKDYKLLAPSSTELDLMDTPAVDRYMTHHQPDIVVHAAGKVGGINANIAAPVSFLDDNVMIGRNVIMSAYKAGVKQLINLASTCIYPKDISSSLTEEMMLSGPLEPTNEGYAIAKILALRLCEYIRKEDSSYFYKTLIPCNLYGLYDKFDPKNSHLLPAIIHKVHQAKMNDSSSVEIWGDGMARREFMYSADLADSIFAAIDKIDTLPDTTNVGVGTDHTINEYYETVARVLGWQGQFDHDLTKPVGMARKLSDVTRQSDWGWHPTTSLEVGIAKTYQHYLEINNHG